MEEAEGKNESPWDTPHRTLASSAQTHRDSQLGLLPPLPTSSAAGMGEARNSLWRRYVCWTREQIASFASSRVRPGKIRPTSRKLPVRQTAGPGIPPASGGSFSEVMWPGEGFYQHTPGSPPMLMSSLHPQRTQSQSGPLVWPLELGGAWGATARTKGGEPPRLTRKAFPELS